MHHLDIHVRDLAAATRLLDALAPHVGYERRSTSDDYVSYWRGGVRPAVGLLLGERAGSAMMRLAFSVPTRAAVDDAAEAVAAAGARAIEGPGVHPEYGDYYAVFFEDSDGNKFEVCADQA